MHGFEEVERPRLFARGVRKLHAVLAHERTLLELLEQAHATKRPVGVGHQRLADVMARKYFLLEEDYLAPFARQHTGNGTPCGSTTHYYDVVMYLCSCVAYGSQFRFKKFRKKTIHFK